MDESLTQPDGTVETGTATFIYYRLNRRIREEYSGSPPASGSVTEYGLDLVGNRVTKTTTRDGGDGDDGQRLRRPRPAVC